MQIKPVAVKVVQVTRNFAPKVFEPRAYAESTPLLCAPMPRLAPPSAAHAAEAWHWDPGRLHCKELSPKAGAEHGLRATCRRVPVCASSRAAASSIPGLGKNGGGLAPAAGGGGPNRPPRHAKGGDVVGVHVVTCLGCTARVWIGWRPPGRGVAAPRVGSGAMSRRSGSRPQGAGQSVRGSDPARAGPPQEPIRRNQETGWGRGVAGKAQATGLRKSNRTSARECRAQQAT